MEHNKKFLWKNWLSGLWIDLFLASSTIAFAEGGNTDPVEFEGSWHEGICSLSLECPVSVTVDALYLYIYRKYIHAIGYYIKLWEETDFVKETEAPAEPLPVAIPISHLKKRNLISGGIDKPVGGLPKRVLPIVVRLKWELPLSLSRKPTKLNNSPTFSYL